MSTRGTLRVEDADGDVLWAYITSDAGDHAREAIITTDRWAVNRRPTAGQYFHHLKKLKNGSLFERGSENFHPFSDEAFGSDEESRRVFGGGMGSPFNEYEYHVKIMNDPEGGSNVRYEQVRE